MYYILEAPNWNNNGYSNIDMSPYLDNMVKKKSPIGENSTCNC